jgi:hypothetical protein
MKTRSRLRQDVRLHIRTGFSFSLFMYMWRRISSRAARLQLPRTPLRSCSALLSLGRIHEEHQPKPFYSGFSSFAAKMAPPEARVIESEHPDKVRMLVLETDDPHPDTQEEVGSFGEVLNEVLVRAGEQHDPKLAISTIIHYAVEPRGGRIPEPSEITEDIHAILITGSVYDAHSNDAWVLKLMDLIKRKSPSLGR